jgi:hypothetical protein
MSVAPSTPKVLRGAIVGIDAFNPIASVIVFQYNPDTLSRTLTPSVGTGSQQMNRSQPLRLRGAPAEQINASIEIDATDQLETADAVATRVGIYPQLSALEMLVYPKSAAVLQNTVALARGTAQVIAPEAPLTLFVWGVRRILPVRLTAFTIAEEAYDVDLNPIRAKVTLGMRVLSYNDLPLSNPGYSVFVAHQVVKEAMAATASVSDISAVASGGVRQT